MPRGSDRLLAVINNEERTTHAHTHTHTHTHTHMQTPSSHLYTSPRLCSVSLCPPPSPRLACSSSSPRSPSFLYDELLGGFSVWQEALSLIRDEKKKKKKAEKERETERKKEEDGEGGWKLETPGGTSPHIVRICLTASQEGLHLPLNTRGIITDQNKLPICSQQRCLPVKSPELHKI